MSAISALHRSFRRTLPHKSTRSSRALLCLVVLSLSCLGQLSGSAPTAAAVRAPEVASDSTGPDVAPGDVDDLSPCGALAADSLPSCHWFNAASMDEPRYHHTATLLPNGQVLVAGGYYEVVGDPYQYRYLSSAELYDPHSNAWRSAGSMSIARIQHTATLLTNGQVLVAGGNTGSGEHISSVEIYDPITGTWHMVARMLSARGGHTAVPLPDGQVLIVGGDLTSGSAELYDPATNTWRPAGSMITHRQDFTATVLPNGQVLVAGGSTQSGYTSSVEVYDPGTDTWREVARMLSARGGHTATLLSNGQVLVAGGQYENGESLQSVELYSPVTDTWESAGSMSAAHYSMTATLLATGQVLVTGYPRRAELYDPIANTWHWAGTMAEERSGSTATLLLNGHVFVVGGLDYDNDPGEMYLDTAELYDPFADTWDSTGNLSVARWDHAATLLSGGRVFVTGGHGAYDGSGNPVVWSSAELYHSGSNTWTLTGEMAMPRYGHTATLLRDGQVLVAGGYYDGEDQDSEELSSAERYDPIHKTWHSAASMSTVRGDHTAILLRNGQVIVIAQSTTSGSAEIYDPTTDTWRPASNMTTAREGHTATLLPGGQVLVVGGYTEDGPTGNAEIYDPATDTWHPAGSMPIERVHHTATLLPDGQVLVTGGYGDGSDGVYLTRLRSAELYDPAINTWIRTGSMSTGRYNHTATLLPGGRVLVAGGSKSSGRDEIDESSVEIYDMVDGLWSPTKCMTTDRASHTATPLPGGRVLVVSGNTAEFYDWALSHLYLPLISRH